MDKNGLGRTAQSLTGLSILIGGKNTFGYTGEATKVSDIEFVMVGEESTGIVKPLTMTLEIFDLGAEYITHIITGLPFVLKGNIHEGGVNKPYMIAAQGDLKKMGTDIKVGESVKRTFELNISMYSEVVDNLPTVVYHKDPYSCILGGVDTSKNFSDNV
jgi:hypothetical protein